MLADLLVGGVRVIRVSRSIWPSPDRAQALLLLKLSQRFVDLRPIFVQVLVLVAHELVVIVGPLVVEVIHGKVAARRVGGVVLLE